MGLLWQVKAHSPSTLWLWLTPVSPGRMIADGFHHKNARVVLWIYSMTSLVAQMVKHLTTMRETQVRSLGWEDPQEKEMATHSSTLAWKISWTEEHGRLQSMGSQRVGHDLATSLSVFHIVWEIRSVSLNLFILLTPGPHLDNLIQMFISWWCLV